MVAVVDCAGRLFNGTPVHTHTHTQTDTKTYVYLFYFILKRGMNFRQIGEQQMRTSRQHFGPVTLSPIESKDGKERERGKKKIIIKG